MNPRVPPPRRPPSSGRRPGRDGWPPSSPRRRLCTRPRCSPRTTPTRSTRSTGNAWKGGSPTSSSSRSSPTASPRSPSGGRTASRWRRRTVRPRPALTDAERSQIQGFVVILCVRRALTETGSLRLEPYTYRVHMDLHSTVSYEDTPEDQPMPSAPPAGGRRLHAAPLGWTQAPKRPTGAEAPRPVRGHRRQPRGDQRRRGDRVHAQERRDDSARSRPGASRTPRRSGSSTGNSIPTRSAPGRGPRRSLHLPGVLRHERRRHGDDHPCVVPSPTGSRTGSSGGRRARGPGRSTTSGDRCGPRTLGSSS